MQVANELFYRDKAVWLIGKLIRRTARCRFCSDASTDEGLFVDTCLTTTEEASIAFGFARSYFMVYAPLPAALVEWLREILPGKTTAELYMAIGCQKHAKPELPWISGQHCQLMNRSLKRRHSRHGDAGVYAAGF
ncbi:isocitrate dehydrogenase kinase/phosphatase AceK regulatory subunit [Shigella flexneri]